MEVSGNLAQPTLHVELVTEARGLQAEYATTMQVLQAPHAVCTFWPKGDKLESGYNSYKLLHRCSPAPIYRGGFLEVMAIKQSGHGTHT